MKKIIICLSLVVMLNACAFKKNSMFKDGMIDRPMVNMIDSQKKKEQYFTDLKSREWKYVFQYGYPDAIIQMQKNRAFSFVDPEDLKSLFWIYLDRGESVIISKTSAKAKPLDDRLRYVCLYGYPDAMDRRSKLDGEMEVWQYFELGLSYSFLNGKLYRKNSF